MNYDIVSAEHRPDLIRKVREKIALGWRIEGRAFFVVPDTGTDPRWFQTMTKQQDAWRAYS